MSSFLDDFWWDIIRRANDRVRFVSEFYLLRDPEICYFDVPIQIEKDVLRLQVSIDDPVLVQVLKSQQYLRRVESRPKLSKVCSTLFHRNSPLFSDGDKARRPE